MHPTRRKTPRVLAFGIASLVLILCFTTEAVNLVFASPLPAATAQQVAYTAAPANTAVTTYKQDNGHTGDQTNETILNTSNVNSSNFGKKVSYPVDGQVYAQPLYMPNVTIGGTPHNVVFVATEHDSVYAFDADQTSAVAPLWHTNYLGSSTISPSNIDENCNDTIPEDGLTETPVIDPATGTLYVVILTKDTSNGSYTYNLHAIDITTGQDKPGSPIKISGSVSGTGVDSVNGKVTFNSSTERQRAALVLSQGKVYVGFASFCDHNPYHGWIMSYSYDGSAFQQTNIYNITPDGTRGGVWGAGGAITADSAGDIFYASGNGTFDGKTNFGDSFVKLDQNLKVLDYFSPFNQSCLDAEDADLGSGGPLLVPGQNRLIGAGKEGRIYVVDTTNMGKYTNPFSSPDLCQNEQKKTNIDKVVEELPQSTIGGLYSSGAYWQSASGQTFIYYAGSNDNLKAFAYSGGLISPSFSSIGSDFFSFTGGNPVVSSNNGATGTGIVWTLAPQGSGTSQTGVLRAYDATNLSNELYNSQNNAGRDGLPAYVKFSDPTVANGEVFVGTKGALDIYGLLASSSPGTPTASPTATGTPNPQGYNNVGISFDDNTKVANYDGGTRSYSESALNTDGILINGLVTGSGFVFRWPNVPTGSPDNWVANGETISVAPVSNADHLAFLGSATGGAASGTATVTYTDGSTQNVTLGFNDWAAPSNNLQFGNTVVAQMPYRNVSTGQQNIVMNLYIDSVAIQAGKTVKSVTLPAIVTGGRLHVFAIGTSSLTSPLYNSVCVQDDGHANAGSTSDNGNLSPVNCDNLGYGYSAQALQAIGITPGSSVLADNFNFAWPDVVENESDNYLADGQTIAVNPVNKADTLGFLGMATNGTASGTATITYTDNTQQTFTLGFSDWASTTVSFGNTVAAQMSYRDRSDGSKQTKSMFLYVASVSLQAGKTVASVTLPSTTSIGFIHVFAVATRSATAPVFNNVGITDDSNISPGGFDAGGRSYSTEALRSAGLNAGDNAFDPTRVVSFTWPDSAPGTADNYVCNGQVLAIDNPQANSSILAFLGSASYGPASGTITVTYTDNTTQTFTLGFDDWTLNGGTTQKLTYSNESIAYSMGYRNTRSGQQSLKNYVFYTFVSIDPTKTVASVTLPSTTTGGVIHIFAVTAAAAN